MAGAGAETEIRGDGLVTVIYDASLNDPGLKYTVNVNRERTTNLLVDIGYTAERLSIFTLKVDTCDRTSPFQMDDKAGTYNAEIDQITIFTRPHRIHKRSPTASLLHEIYHSIDDRLLESSKWARRIQRWSPAIMLAPMAAGLAGAYLLTDANNPSPVPFLVALLGVPAGIAAGIMSSEFPNTLSGRERRAWRFSKEKMKDPNLRDLITLVPK